MGRFFQRLPPLLAVVTFVGIAWFDWGADYNVPALLWHEHHAIQFCTGLSVNLLFWYLWLVAFLVEVRAFGRRNIAALVNPAAPGLWRWYDQVVTWIIGRPRDVTEFQDGFRWFMAATWAPAAVVVTAAALADLGHRWWFLAGSVTAFVVVWAVTLVSRGRMVGSNARGMRWLARAAFAGLFLAYLTIVILRDAQWTGWGQAQYFNTLPPLVSVCLLFAVLGGIVGAIGYYCGRRPLLHVAVWAAAVGWLVYCGWGAYKLRLPGLAYAAAGGASPILALYDAEEPEAPPDGKDALDVPDWVGKAAPDAVRKRLGPAYRRLAAALGLDEKTVAAGTGLPPAELFARTRKYQLVLLYRQLREQLEPDRPPAELVPPADVDKLSYRTWFDRYETTVADVGKVEESRVLNQWRAGLAGAYGRADDKQFKPKMIVVAVTGGANRSALWAGVVLSRLETEIGGRPDADGRYFPRHVRLVAGASGGMVGAAHWVTTLDDRGRHVAWAQSRDGGPWQRLTEPDGHPVRADLLPKFEPVDKVDYLTPVVNRLVFKDAPFLAWPRHYDEDRGWALEECFAGTTHEMEQSFADLRPGEWAGWRPSLVFSPMVVEDGRRLLVSNLALPYLASADGSFLIGDDQAARPRGVRAKQSLAKTGEGHRDRYCRSAVELFRLFPGARSKFKVSTAARMSATFPFISPAVELPTDPPRRVVDAGYYDNFGVNVAAGWIYRHRDWLTNNTAGVVLVQIRDGQSHRARRQLLPDGLTEPGQTVLGDSFGWLTSPLAGAESARVSVTSFRNDEQLQVLTDAFKPAGADFFTTVVFERPGSVGMNWYLSETDRHDIVHGLDRPPNTANLRLLREWWGSGSANR
jgi:hypothetical protein